MVVWTSLVCGWQLAVWAEGPPGASPTGGPGASSQAAGAVNEPTIVDLLRLGGPIMWPLGVCSVLFLAFALERLMSMRRRRVIPPIFIEELRRLTEDGRLDPKPLGKLCEQYHSPIASVVQASLIKVGRPVLEVEKAMEDACAREVAILRAGIRPLTAIASIAPLLGLLGTVFGMIKAFIVTSQPGLKDRTELLSTGIYEALVATAAGLVIAIPSLIAAYYFTGRLDRLARELGDHLTPLVLPIAERGGHRKVTPEETAKAL